jgi:lipopolysaccharide transport system ATP-binding protein
MPSESSGDQIAIQARGVTKAYEIYARPQDRLKQMLWPRGRRLFREFLAVRDVDLTVLRGETVGIVGRNGSGKSTLLQMISGTLEPTSGGLEVHGHVAPILALGVGFDPEFTGRDNVLINGAILGLTDAEISQRLQSIIDFADIGTFFDQPVKTYSSGMYSRLAFAVAINADPEILVIDELLAVGDEAFVRKCFGRIEEIKLKGSTILFVSHAANLVVELCDRAVLLDQGERLLTADPKTVISRYQRLLHAPDSKVEAIREEIRAIDRHGEEPTGTALTTAETVSIDTTVASEDSTEGVSIDATQASEDEGQFDPNLMPESTVEYERRGAYIENPRILASDGTQVNVLRAGRTYTYTYDVTFLAPAYAVRFGMLIKLATGFELGGQASHPEGEGIESIEAGSKARVRFSFQTLLVPGAYFLNAGVVASLDGAEGYLHRILDAVMFRVQAEERGRTTGTVDLGASAAAEIELVEPEKA